MAWTTNCVCCWPWAGVPVTRETSRTAPSSRNIVWADKFIKSGQWGRKQFEGSELYGSTGFGTQAWGDFGLVPEEPASDRFLAWTQSVALGTEIAERTTMYNEFYGIFSYGLEDDYAEVYFNIGADYYVTNNLVLDLRVGVGLTPDSDDFFSGVGGGYRF